MGRRNILRYIIIICLSVVLFGCSGVSTLVELKRDLNSQRRLLVIQKRNFQKIQRAIKRDKLKKDLNADYIVRKYGQPVVRIAERKNNRTRWVYIEDTFLFSGPKAYLYFDTKDKLVEWEYLDKQ